jgi:replicative superfamily II helicase
VKRYIVAVALGSCIISSTAPALSHPAAAVAPADRYFGRLQMSILGVRNSLRDLSQQLDARPDDAVHVYDKAVFVEDALHDWAKKFPNDPWIPKFAHQLEELYAKIDTDDARSHRAATSAWLIQTFPSSSYAQIGSR